MSAHCCMYCLRDISRYNLDFKRDIVCGMCVQRLISAPEYPRKRIARGSVSPATARKVCGVRQTKGKKTPTGVR